MASRCDRDRLESLRNRFLWHVRGLIFRMGGASLLPIQPTSSKMRRHISSRLFGYRNVGTRRCFHASRLYLNEATAIESHGAAEPTTVSSTPGPVENGERSGQIADQLKDVSSSTALGTRVRKVKLKKPSLSGQQSVERTKDGSNVESPDQPKRENDRKELKEISHKLKMLTDNLRPVTAPSHFRVRASYTSPSALTKKSVLCRRMLRRRTRNLLLFNSSMAESGLSQKKLVPGASCMYQNPGESPELTYPQTSFMAKVRRSIRWFRMSDRPSGTIANAVNVNIQSQNNVFSISLRYVRSRCLHLAYNLSGGPI